MVIAATEHGQLVLERKNQENRFFLSKRMPNLQFFRTHSFSMLHRYNIRIPS